MIISHLHRFIFFAVPKTATHAVREALRTHMGPEDWEQQMLSGRQALPIPEMAKIAHGHISVQQLRPNLNSEIFDDYHKFAIVRNPYDRFISACFFLNRDNPDFSTKPIENMKALLRRSPFRQRILIQPQWKLLTDRSHVMRMDTLGRYENLQLSFNEICNKIGMPETDLSLRNSSTHDAFNEHYDEELAAMVAQFYRGDFEMFDYDINLLPQSSSI